MSNVIFQICKFLQYNCFTVFNLMCLHVSSMFGAVRNLFHVDFDGNCGLRSKLLLDTSKSDTIPYFSCITTVNMVCSKLNYVSPTI